MKTDIINVLSLNKVFFLGHVYTRRDDFTRLFLYTEMESKRFLISLNTGMAFPLTTSPEEWVDVTNKVQVTRIA